MRNLLIICFLLLPSLAFAQTWSDFVEGLSSTLPAATDKIPVVRGSEPFTATAGSIGLQVAATTAALKLYSTANYSSVLRGGFYASGDVEIIHYRAQNSACSLNAGNGDDASEVKSADNKCWIATFPGNKPNVRQFGAKGDDSNDDGPAFRAACAWAMANSSNPVYVPSGVYLFNTLESDGGAGLYLNTGLTDGKACSLEGPSSAFDYPYAPGPLDGPAVLKLGASKNRPLLRQKELGATAHLKNLTVDGNRGNQTGWIGGPATGRLFTIQENDTVNPYPETGIIFDDVVVQNGYNGNLYVGAGRYMVGTRLWSNYSGQDTNDYSIWIIGYDSTFWWPAIGNNTGGGIFLEQGSQFQIGAGAIWQNGAAGLGIGGLQVNYATIWGTNFHNNNIGIRNYNWVAYAGNSIAGVTCTGCTFDQSVYADVQVDAGATNRQMKLVAPSFLGDSSGTESKPTYNIVVSGTGAVEITTPIFGTGGTFLTAFTNAPSSVLCTGADCPSTAFTPTLGNGTPTYVSQSGYAIKAGKMVHAQYSVSISDKGGATGDMYVGGLPWYAAATSGSAGCPLVMVDGWTAPAGYDWLTSSVSETENSVILRKNSKTAQPSGGAAVGEFAATTTISGSCSYIGTN